MVEACLRAAASTHSRAATSVCRSPRPRCEDREVLVVEVSSFQLALQDSFHPSRLGLGERRPRPPRLARRPRGLRRREAAHLRAAVGRRRPRRQSGRPGRGGDLGHGAVRVRWFRRGPPAEGGGGVRGRELVARLDGGASARARRGRGGRGARMRPPRPPSRSPRRGAEPAAAAAALADFRPGPHRGEVVATVGGVRFVDNSKATNVHAAAAAIDAAGDAVLIAGGRAKGADLSPLRDHAGRPARRGRDRRGGARTSWRCSMAPCRPRSPGRSRTRSARRSRRPDPATPSCSRPRARAGTSSAATPSAATGSPRPPARSATEAARG